jgi:hypothetical protein
MNIQLTVEEALKFQQIDAELRGFVAGAMAAADHFRRLKIQEIVAARANTDQPNTEPAAL